MKKPGLPVALSRALSLTHPVDSLPYVDGPWVRRWNQNGGGGGRRHYHSFLSPVQTHPFTRTLTKDCPFVCTHVFAAALQALVPHRLIRRYNERGRIWNGALKGLYEYKYLNLETTRKISYKYSCSRFSLGSCERQEKNEKNNANPENGKEFGV